MATRFPFAVLAGLAIPLLATASPVPRTPAKHEVRAIRSLDNAVVILTDRDESVPEFLARSHRDGTGVFTMKAAPAANRVDAGDRVRNVRRVAAEQQIVNQVAAVNNVQIQNGFRNWQIESVQAPDERIGTILSREIDAEKDNVDNLILLVRVTEGHKYEVIGYARNADALKHFNPDYRPQPIEHRQLQERLQWRNNVQFGQFGGC
jgi:hypothetical protein